jgi:hypothetical protein
VVQPKGFFIKKYRVNNFICIKTGDKEWVYRELPNAFRTILIWFSDEKSENRGGYMKNKYSRRDFMILQSKPKHKELKVI